MHNLEFLSFLVIPIIGAIIAFSTNLLAIVMIFRPHKEVRIFGLRVPFTPGLVPRQRQQLAQKMGETIAENILTSNALVEAVSNTSIVDNIVDIVQNFIEKIVTSHDSISKIAADLLKRDEEEVAQAAVQNSEKLMGKILEVAQEYAQDKALPYLQSEDFARLVTDFVNNSLANARNSETKLSDIIPQGAVTAAKGAAKNNMHRLGPICRDFLADARVDARLRELVAKIVKENANGFMGLFVNADKIYDSIAQNLLKYLDDAENQALIYEKIVAFVDGYLDKEIGQLTDKLDKSSIDNWLETAISALQRNLKQEHVEKIFNGITSHVAPEKAVVHLLSMAPSQILPNNANYRQSIDSFVRKTITILAQKAGEYMIASLDVAKIAEGRINAFEMHEMERLVLSVVGKHLKWIVLLGGFLGFFMGLLPAAFGIFF
ncbi:MAG: DUF445 family protein [Defluviitaleaceae bacterium]|nr:DUF445 family protein [Defluviitaleaceae bacterium]